MINDCCVSERSKRRECFRNRGEKCKNGCWTVAKEYDWFSNLLITVNIVNHRILTTLVLGYIIIYGLEGRGVDRR